MAKRFNRGDTVRIWFDDNWHGSWLHGQVTAAGPKCFYVTWESGLRNRLRQGDHRVERARKVTEAPDAPDARHHSPFANVGVC